MLEHSCMISLQKSSYRKVIIHITTQVCWTGQSFVSHALELFRLECMVLPRISSEFLHFQRWSH